MVHLPIFGPTKPKRTGTFSCPSCILASYQVNFLIIKTNNADIFCKNLTNLTANQKAKARKIKKRKSTGQFFASYPNNYWMSYPDSEIYLHKYWRKLIKYPSTLIRTGKQSWCVAVATYTTLQKKTMRTHTYMYSLSILYEYQKWTLKKSSKVSFIEWQNCSSIFNWITCAEVG